MLLKTICTIFVVFPLSVQGALDQRGWHVTYTSENICALKGTSVDMACTYTYPSGYTVQTTFWFKYRNHGEELADLAKTTEYKGRVEYLGDKKHHSTLRLKALKKSDSGGYYFRFITNKEGCKWTGVSGSQLSVTALQASVIPDTVTEGQRVTLTCSTTCTLSGSPAFIWYKNRHPLSNTNQNLQLSASSEDAGSYSCAVRGYEHLPSSAVTLNVRYAPQNTSVSVSPSAEIVKGSSVTLTCSSNVNPPVQSYTWFKNDTGVWQTGSGQSLNFTNITLWDSGQYYCEAKNKLGNHKSTAVTVDVLYVPQNTSVSVSPSGEIVKGSSVTLTCSSNANPPVHSYTWFKDNGVGTLVRGSGQSYSITNIRSEDSGQYYCEAKNKHGAQNSTAVTITAEIGNGAALPWTILGIAVFVAIVLVGVIACMRKKRETPGEKIRGTDIQTAHPDPPNDTYTTLNLKAVSPDYDTLKNVRATASDTNTVLSEYENLGGRTGGV